MPEPGDGPPRSKSHFGQGALCRALGEFGVLGEFGEFGVLGEFGEFRVLGEFGEFGFRF